MTSRVRERDRGAAALLKRLGQAGQRPIRISVGVHEEEGAATSDEGTTVAEVATFNEFGLGVPQRSFVREWFDENERENAEAMRKIADAVLAKGGDPADAAERFGLYAVGSMQKRIADGIDPPNAESTIARKGSSTPLIDDGVLWTSITHKVHK